MGFRTRSRPCAMKILVFAHHLVVGGTPLNSIELSAALQDTPDQEVVFFATPGPMLRLVEQHGLRYVPAPEAYIHPSLARMRAIRNLVRRECPDVIHVWDWFQCLEAYYAVHLTMRIPMVVTDMFMSLTSVLPTSLVTTFGTPELVDQARRAGRPHAHLLLPPVDTKANAPTAIDPSAFKAQYSLESPGITLATVSRLDRSMKYESIAQTIDAVALLGKDIPLRLLITGDGSARPALEQRATLVNEHLRRHAIVFTGELLDPRPVYASADVVVGMGGSALRGMAFGKPVIIVGERGFSAPFTAETADTFYYRGMFGSAATQQPVDTLACTIRRLIISPQQLPAYGDFSRRFVIRHFSLQTVSQRLLTLCYNAVQTRPPLRATMADALRSLALYLRHRLFMRRSVDWNQIRQMRRPPVALTQ